MEKLSSEGENFSDWLVYIRLGIYTFFAEGEKFFEMLGIYTRIYTSQPLYLEYLTREVVQTTGSEWFMRLPQTATLVIFLISLQKLQSSIE